MRTTLERDVSNNPFVSYTRGNDLSGAMEDAGGIGGLLARSSGYSGGNFTTHNYYFADGNGNITYMLNSSQAMVASYRYDPFGNTISSSGTLASANVYRFSSKEIHANSGMYYYGYRFYDPNLQRWINRDPLAECRPSKQRHSIQNGSPFGFGPNSYEFANNCPIDLVDPYGLFSFCEWLSIGGEFVKGAAQGLAAAGDGFTGMFGGYPFERFYDPTDPTFQWSQALGEVGGVSFALAIGATLIPGPTTGPDSGDGGIGPGSGRGPTGPIDLGPQPTRSIDFPGPGRGTTPGPSWPPGPGNPNN